MSLHVKMLVEAYQERKTKNSQFSMNAFARLIKMSPSQFNEVLNQKCGVSLKKAKEVAVRLEFTDLQQRFFCLSVEAEHSRSEEIRKKAKKELRSVLKNVSVQLQVETFAMVSSWHHFAILELLNLDDFSPNEAWISQRLNIDKSLVKSAVIRLKKLGLIKVKGNQWIRSEGLVQTTNDIPSAGIKKYHCQILSLGEQAVLNLPVEEREFNSVFLALDHGLIPQLKMRIRRFQEKIISDFSLKSKKKDSLVSLNMQMFPIGKTSN